MNQPNQTSREKPLRAGKGKANLFETKGLFSGEGAEESSWGVQQRCCRGAGQRPLPGLGTDGVGWVPTSPAKCSGEIQPGFSATRSLQVSAAKEVSDKVQQSFSELPPGCPAGSGRAAGQGGVGRGARAKGRGGGCFQSVVRQGARGGPV